MASKIPSCPRYIFYLGYLYFIKVYFWTIHKLISVPPSGMRIHCPSMKLRIQQHRRSSFSCCSLLLLSDRAEESHELFQKIARFSSQVEGSQLGMVSGNSFLDWSQGCLRDVCILRPRVVFFVMGLAVTQVIIPHFNQCHQATNLSLTLLFLQSMSFWKGLWSQQNFICLY